MFRSLGYDTDVTSLLSLVEAEAAAPPYIFAAFQGFQCHFVKYQRRWGKT